MADYEDEAEVKVLGISALKGYSLLLKPRVVSARRRRGKCRNSEGFMDFLVLQ